MRYYNIDKYITLFIVYLIHSKKDCITLDDF